MGRREGHAFVDHELAVNIAAAEPCYATGVPRGGSCALPGLQRGFVSQCKDIGARFSPESVSPICLCRVGNGSPLSIAAIGAASKAEPPPKQCEDIN